jgi:hypothetical protein
MMAISQRSVVAMCVSLRQDRLHQQNGRTGSSGSDEMGNTQHQCSIGSV